VNCIAVAAVAAAAGTTGDCVILLNENVNVTVNEKLQTCNCKKTQRKFTEN